MKKRLQKTKFTLNKETIVNLTRVDMRNFRGGADGSDIGLTCYTEKCCVSKKISCDALISPILSDDDCQG